MPLAQNLLSITFFATLSTCTVTSPSFDCLESVLTPSYGKPSRMAILSCACSPSRLFYYFLSTYKLQLWMMKHLKYSSIFHEFWLDSINVTDRCDTEMNKTSWQRPMKDRLFLLIPS